VTTLLASMTGAAVENFLDTVILPDA